VIKIRFDMCLLDCTLRSRRRQDDQLCVRPGIWRARPE
jgi:hypothetical protein